MEKPFDHADLVAGQADPLPCRAHRFEHVRGQPPMHLGDLLDDLSLFAQHRVTELPYWEHCHV